MGEVLLTGIVRYIPLSSRNVCKPAYGRREMRREMKRYITGLPAQHQHHQVRFSGGENMQAMVHPNTYVGCQPTCVVWATPVCTE